MNKKDFCPRPFVGGLVGCQEECDSCALNSVVVNANYRMQDPLLEFVVFDTPANGQPYSVFLPPLISSDALANPNKRYITTTLLFRNIDTTFTETIVAAPGSTIFQNLATLSVPPLTSVVLKSTGNIWFRIL